MFTSGGLLVMQVILVFLVLTWMLVQQWQVHRLHRRWAEERVAAIREVQRVADELATKTAAIAEQLKHDTLRQTVVTASELEAKMNEILTRFDAAGGNHGL